MSSNPNRAKEILDLERKEARLTERMKTLNAHPWTNREDWRNRKANLSKDLSRVRKRIYTLSVLEGRL